MINWEEAPEGTTHGTEEPIAVKYYGSWRKLEEGKWYYHNTVEWVFRSDSKDYLNNNPHLIGRPAPVEAELPEGKVWPEGADFYYPPADAFFRFDEPAYQFGHLNHWSGIALAAVQEYAVRVDSIHRWAGARPKAAPKKEEPPKKRAVGWWT